MTLSNAEVSESTCFSLFQQQVNEPDDTLFIVYERNKKKFKYFGCELDKKFEVTIN